ncbi:MAG: O-antigen ligase family protein [Planctomycetia bacterium]|nr:O-antigen ligase family protein [Planctomycetia bacterium]
MSRRKKTVRDPSVPPAETAPKPDADRLRPWLLGATVAMFVARPLFPSESIGDTGEGIPLVMLALVLAALWAVRMARRGRPWRWGATDAAVLALERNPDGMLRAEGLWFPPDSVERRQFENRLESVEPLASFALTNSLAGYLAPWLVVALGIGVGAVEHRRRVWLAVAASGVLVAACLVLTKSRSAYVATLLGLVLVAVFCRRRERRPGTGGGQSHLRGEDADPQHNVGRAAKIGTVPYVLAAAAGVTAVLVVLAVAVGGLDVEVLSEASKSLGYRVQYWQSTVAMIEDHPIMGCGPGHFQDAYPRYKLPEASEEIADPHNFLLEVWATAGTPTMLAMLAVLGCFGWTLWKPKSRDPAEQEEETRDNPDATAAIFGGALVGVLAAWPLGILGTTPPGLVVLLAGLPLGAVAVALLRRWVDDGRFPATLAAIGLVVLLVNLLAAGGIGFPGVAGTFWLLLALGLCQAEASPARNLPRVAAMALVATFFILGAICYRTAYQPVLTAQAEINAARGKPADVTRHLHAAAVDDPLSAEAWKLLASVAFTQWQQDHDPGTLQQYHEYNATALELDPNASPAWAVSGDRCLEAHGVTGQPEELQAAVLAYRRAIELYPNNATYHAKLAVALQTAGDEPGFRREADAALELDRQNPHEDKRIGVELRSRLNRRGL